MINRDLEFYLTDELINAFSYKYKFFDVEENRVQETAIYSPYNHFAMRGLSFGDSNKNDVYTCRLGDEQKKNDLNLYLSVLTLSF